MFTLANTVTMEHLPKGPALERWLYEQPVPTMVVLVVMGLIGAYTLRQAGKYKASPIPVIAGAVLAVGVWSLASAVETSRETIKQSTRAFVDAMTSEDYSSARALLDRDVLLSAAGSEYPIDVDSLASLSREIPKHIDAHNLRKISASLDGENVGRTRFDITISADGTPIPMGWEVGWHRVGGEWRIVRIECKHIWHTAPQNKINRWIPRLGGIR